jgi:hypothetical protein
MRSQDTASYLELSSEPDTADFSDGEAADALSDMSWETSLTERDRFGRSVLLVWLAGLFLVATLFRRVGVLGGRGVLWLAILASPTVLTSVLLVAGPRKMRQASAVRSREILPWALLIGLACLSTLVGHRMLGALGHIAVLSVVIANGFLLRSRLDEEDVRWALTRYGCFFVCVVFPLSVKALLTGHRFGAAALGLNPNGVAHLTLGAAAAIMLLAHRRLRYILLLLAGLIAFSTGSRSGLLSLTVLAWVMLGRKFIEKPARATLAGLAICIFLAIGLALGPNLSATGRFLEERLALSDPDRGVQHGLDKGRRESNRLLWEMFLSSPILGRGYRAEDVVLPELSMVGSHNGYLSWLAGTGILGMSFALWIIFGATARFTRAGDYFSTVLLGLIWAFLAAAVVERFLFNTGNPTGIMLTFVLIYSGTRRRPDDTVPSTAFAEDER